MTDLMQSKNQQEKRIKRNYLLSFQYIKNEKLLKEYLSTLREKGVSFNEKEFKQKKGQYPFKDLQDVFEIEVTGEHCSSGDMEKLILQSWCPWARENEKYGLISIKPKNASYLQDKTKSLTKINSAKFCVGAFKSPTQFCQHFPPEELGMKQNCSIAFEYDMDFLSISLLQEACSESTFRFELSNKTFINCVTMSKQGQELSIYIETDERFKISIVKGSKISMRTNFDLFDDIKLHQNFGLSSVFQITFSDETLDVGLEIIAYLKRKDITVVYGYTELTESYYSLDELNQTIKFNDFETEYAWQCLLHRGYKVIDSLDSAIIKILKRHRNSDLAEKFFEMESMVDNNNFFDFEHNWIEAMKPKADKNEEHESRLSNLYARRIVVTPTSEIFFKKEPTKQNRVILQYNVDCFLRVVFRDEDFRKLQLLSKEPEVGSIIERVKNFLRDGIRIGDRHFEFLGCSNSQMREHGAWFVAEYDGITAESIRKSLGDFTRERCIASYVSRLGLCFSSSLKTVDVESYELINDVENEDYCFTDGIGKMSESLAQKISSALEISQTSAFQIRYAGSKGVIALDPQLGEEERLILRNSMQKFESPSKTLEILQWTKPSRLFLNRQVITLMSGLGVPDNAFLSLQQKFLLKLTTMLTDEDKALEELSLTLKTLHYKCLRSNGVMLTKDPFFRSVLVTIYKYRIDGMLRKSRIPFSWSKGRIMMGTVDETGSLNYGQAFIAYSTKSESSKCKAVVHKGTVVVAKNPCFHPGDLRKFEAVDIPDLHHMVDCIVFPQKGHRPHPDEMSGSDLDGDMYFVCWDQSFIQPNKNETPMDFPKSEKTKLDREIMEEDVVEFLGNYIKNDRLGVIANAHVVHADMSSIFSPQCLELAKLHSDAVDFPKTGKIPEIGKELIVEKYPDFMMKKDKELYKSEKILGKLFRQCEFIAKNINRSKHCELIIERTKEDPDFLQNGYQQYLKSSEIAFNVYSQKISDLMNYYGIKTEAELFTGMFLSMKSQRGCLEKERFELVELIQTKLSKICRDTRMEFFKEFGGEQNAKDFHKVVQAKASAWYKVSYGSYSRKRRFLSFPWLVAEYVVSNTREDESKCIELSRFTEIGSTVEKNARKNLGKRADLFKDMLQHIKCISKANSYILKLPLVGILPLCLLADGHKTISFYTDSPQTEDIATYAQHKFTTKIVADPDVLRKTVFIRCLLEKDPKFVFLLSYVLDWARDRKLVKASSEDELEFAYISANILNNEENLEHDASNLFVSNLKWIKDVRLSKKDLFVLGRETIRFFKEYLNRITVENDDVQNIPSVTEEVLTTVLDLSLNSSLESLDNVSNEEVALPLPYNMWSHFFSAKEYIEQKIQEGLNLPYVNIVMPRGRLLVHAYGPNDKVKHMLILLNQTVWNNNLFINVPAKNLVFIKNSVIFAFEGSSGKGDILDYIRYEGECNRQHKTCYLAIPSQRVSKNQSMTRNVDSLDCQSFTEACLKQIQSVRYVYNEFVHGNITMNIVLGRLYLVNAPKDPTNIFTFEKEISKLTEENENYMRSGKVAGYKGRKFQENKKHFCTKSFIPITYDDTETLQILQANGFELKSKETSYNFRLDLQPMWKSCMVSLDETLKLQYITLASLDWVVADVIREKCQSASLADIRFKLSSHSTLYKNCIRKRAVLNGISEDWDHLLQKSDGGFVTIAANYAQSISKVQEKTVCTLGVPGGKFDILISSIVEYTKLDRSDRLFQNVEKRSEISIVPTLPDLSREDEWDSLLRSIWEFSFHLSNVLDSLIVKI